jgi:hypothetical protein
MLESIAQYWTNIVDPADINKVLADPSEAGEVLQKMCASHWPILFDYLWTRLSGLEMNLRRIEHEWPDSTARLIGTLKTALLASNEWRRRLLWISDELDTSLQSLRVYSFASNAEEKWDHLDFRYLIHRVNMLSVKYEQFNNLMMGILGVVQGELSLREAKTSTELTDSANKAAIHSLTEAKLSSRLTHRALLRPTRVLY